MCSRQACPNTFSFYLKKFLNPSSLFSDVCDSSRVLTCDGRRYFVTFIDDYSKFCYTYLLKSKDEAFDWFKVYKIEADNQLERKIKILRFDCGGVYLKWCVRILPRALYYSWDKCSLHTSIQRCSWTKEQNTDGHDKMHVTQLKCTRKLLERSFPFSLFHSQ